MISFFFSFLLLDGHYICCIFDVYDFFVQLNLTHVTRDMVLDTLYASIFSDIHFDGIPVGLICAMPTDNGLVYSVFEMTGNLALLLTITIPPMCAPNLSTYECG